VTDDGTSTGDTERLDDLSELDLDHPAVRLAKMKKAAEKHRERQENEVVECPECETEVLYEDIEEAIEAAETHDEKRHDGERTTTVNGLLPPSDEVAGAAREVVEQICDVEPDSEQGASN